MLDFRTNTFLVLCKNRNYTKTAKELCITQPAVTQHIQFLEREYQVKLFMQEGKKLHLTEAGKQLQLTLTTMKNDEQHMRMVMLAQKKGKKQIIFGATLSIGEFVLPQKLHLYIEKHPDTELHMRVNNTRELLLQLQEGSIEFAFIEGYFQKTEYDYTVFSSEAYIPVSSPGYRFSKLPEILEDLLSCPLIIREEGSGTREILEKTLDSKNLSVLDFEKVMEMGNMNAIKYLIKQGDGITFLYEAAITEELLKKELIQIPLKNFSITHEFYFVWRKNSIFSNYYANILEEFLNL